jgi:hypothetical protein
VGRLGKGTFAGALFRFQAIEHLCFEEAFGGFRGISTFAKMKLEHFSLFSGRVCIHGNAEGGGSMPPPSAAE